MLSNHINWGIIGCGDVNEIKSGPAFGKVANSNLLAVMRRNGSKAKDFAQRHKVPHWYDDATPLINNPDINAIYIATPPNFHEEYAIQAIKAGKNVYVEKPMSITLASCIRMKNAAEEYKVKLVVAHYRRQLPLYLFVKKQLEENALGAIRYVRLTILQPIKPSLIANAETYWRIDPNVSGGGLFYDLAPHQLDLVCYFFGKPSKYFGIACNQAGQYAAEDIVMGVMLMENNVLFNGLWCFSVSNGSAHDLFEIEGENGRISFQLHGNQATLYKNGKESIVSFNHPYHIQQPMIEKVVNYFLEKGDNPCSADDAIASMNIMEDFVYSNKG